VHALGIWFRKAPIETASVVRVFAEMAKDHASPMDAAKLPLWRSQLADAQETFFFIDFAQCPPDTDDELVFPVAGILAKELGVSSYALISMVGYVRIQAFDDMGRRKWAATSGNLSSKDRVLLKQMRKQHGPLIRASLADVPSVSDEDIREEIELEISEQGFPYYRLVDDFGSAGMPGSIDLSDGIELGKEWQDY
jgi:hypothetical protein